MSLGFRKSKQAAPWCRQMAFFKARCPRAGGSRRTRRQRDRVWRASKLCPHRTDHQKGMLSLKISVRILSGF